MSRKSRPTLTVGPIAALIGALTVWLGVANARAAVAVGDIAVIGYQADDPDAIAFVTLAPISAGESIRFTDSGWQAGGGFRANEGGVEYTFSANTPAGTVVSMTSPFNTGGWIINNVGVGGSGLALATAGDQILAFQGSAAAPSFIFASNTGGGGWNDAISSQTTALPPGLISGTTAIDLSTPERDNGYYSGPTSGTKSQLLAAICNPANWTRSDSPVSFPAWSFSVTSAGGPAITSVSLPGAAFALNDMVLVTVTLDGAPAPGVPAEIDLNSGAFPYTPLVINDPDTSGSVLVTLGVGGSYTVSATAFSGATGSAESSSFTVTAPPTPPVAYAGADRLVTLSSSTVAVAMVGATVTDVNSLAGVSYEWTPVSGPGIVGWSNRMGFATDPSDPAGAIVTIAAPGMYTFTLGAVDPEMTVDFDDVTITVQPGPPVGQYDAPANYYDPARPGGTWLTGPALSSALQGIIDNHTVRSYDAAKFALALLDADPMVPGNVQLVYTGVSVSGAWDAGNTWNREHQWPQSLQPGGSMLSDLHHLRACNPSVNSSRGNKPFGIGGGFWDPDHGAPDRGDSSRAIFYCATRYLGQVTLVNGTPGANQMGDLASMVNFHFQDPPSDFERRRNHLIYSAADNPTYFQGNRNPFIDHPELVWAIWGTGPNDSTLYLGATPAGDGSSADSVHFRVLQNAGAQSSIVSLTKTGAAPTTFDALVDGPFVVMNSGSRQAFVAGPGARNFTISLLDTSTITSLSGDLTFDNTDITSAAPAKGSADANDLVTITADVLAHSNPSFAAGVDTNSTIVAVEFAPDSGVQAINIPIHNFGYTALQALLDIDAVLDLVPPFELSSPLEQDIGAAPGVLSLDFDTTGLSPGLYSIDVTVNLSDEDLPGATGSTLALHLDVTLAPHASGPGDADGSGNVDFDDITEVLANWGANYAPGTGPGDANASGAVDFDDITEVLANWGATCP